MADRDIETVVDGMEARFTKRPPRIYLPILDDEGAPLPCGCTPGHPCPEHEIRPEPER